MWTGAVMAGGRKLTRSPDVQAVEGEGEGSSGVSGGFLILDEAW